MQITNRRTMLIVTGMTIISSAMNAQSALDYPDFHSIGDPNPVRAAAQVDFGYQVQQDFSAAYLPDLYWEWDPEPRWLSGIGFGGRTFFGSLGFGRNFFGSSLLDDEYVEVELRFSSSETTYCQTYRRDLGYPASGVGEFRGSAWDISDPNTPRRLNICFVEDNNQKPANLTWDPDESSLGSREYLFVMASDYDGTGLTYQGTDIGTADALYGWWPRQETGHPFFETDPATLTIRLAFIYGFQALPDLEQISLSWAFEEVGADSFRLYAGTVPSPNTILTTLPVDARTYLHSGLTIGTIFYYRMEAVSSTGERLFRSREVRAFPQQLTSNMSLAGEWNGLDTYGDIWGYTAPDGKEYALLCARNAGLSIIDISASPPLEVGFVPSLFPGNDAKDVKVYDHYAILIKQHEPAQVIDLSNPANPVTVSTIHIGPGEEGGGAHNAFVEGSYLYTMGDHGLGGLTIFDLTNPAAPLKVGEYQPYYYHDGYVRNDTGYFAAAENGVDILNLANKASPTFIANVNYDGSWAHNCWTTENGNHLIIGDENGTSGKWTRIFDISDLNNISMIAEYIVDSSAIVHNSYVRDNYLYVAHYTEGIRLVDITDPASPVEVAFYDTYPLQQYGFFGNWSLYPYFASGKIIASDMQTGLYVLDVDWTALGVELPSDPLPDDFSLAQNYPNPFNPVTTIHYQLPRGTDVSLVVLDLLGREVAGLVDSRQQAGRHQILWTGTTVEGQEVPSGIYFARLVTPGYSKSIKMLLLK